ncbi:MAG: sporulation membrane protein YtaF [Chitinophagales bacterium]
MYLFVSLLLALAVSADGFGVGVAYGLKKIKIPILSILVICLASMLAIGASMVVGKGIALYFSPKLASVVGALALFFVGIWFLSDLWRDSDDKRTEITSIRIRPLGVIIQILREPARADFDSSGVISYSEAFFLGAALAVDALGAGLGAAMAGYNLLATIAAVGCCKFLVLNLGLRLGERLQRGFLKKYSPVIAGLILCLLGIAELVR